MGFTLKSGMVQGFLFNRRPDDLQFGQVGSAPKWKYEVQIDMGAYWQDQPGRIGPVDAVLAAVRDGKMNGVIQGITGYWLVVPDPYHQNSYPVMVGI